MLITGSFCDYWLLLKWHQLGLKFSLPLLTITTFYCHIWCIGQDTGYWSLNKENTVKHVCKKGSEDRGDIWQIFLDLISEVRNETLTNAITKGLLYYVSSLISLSFQRHVGTQNDVKKTLKAIIYIPVGTHPSTSGTTSVKQIKHLTVWQ